MFEFICTFIFGDELKTLDNGFVKLTEIKH